MVRNGGKNLAIPPNGRPEISDFIHMPEKVFIDKKKIQSSVNKMAKILPAPGI
jgi:hypothetical protein